jgi:hypothetical protein
MKKKKIKRIIKNIIEENEVKRERKINKIEDDEIKREKSTRIKLI